MLRGGHAAGVVGGPRLRATPLGHRPRRGRARRQLAFFLDSGGHGLGRRPLLLPPAPPLLLCAGRTPPLEGGPAREEAAEEDGRHTEELRWRMHSSREEWPICIASLLRCSLPLAFAWSIREVALREQYH
jgi:hypothetical protein